MKKRGISGVVVTVLIILVAIIAVLMIWVILKDVIKKSASSIEIYCLTTDLKIGKVEINKTNNILYVQVKRKTGEGNLSRIRFLVYNETAGMIRDKNISMKELEERTFSFNDVGNVSFISKVEIAPVVSLENKNKICRVSDLKKTAGISAISTETEEVCEPACDEGETCENSACVPVPTENYWLLVSLTAGNISEDGDVRYDSVDCTGGLTYSRDSTSASAYTGLITAPGRVVKAYIYFNISSILSGSTITDVDLNISVNIGSPTNCNINDITSPNTTSDANLYADIANGTAYISNNNFCTTTGWKNLDLGATADSDLQNALTRGWFGIGINITVDDSSCGVDYYSLFDTSESANDPELVVTYVTDSTPPT